MFLLLLFFFFFLLLFEWSCSVLVVNQKPRTILTFVQIYWYLLLQICMCFSLSLLFVNQYSQSVQKSVTNQFSFHVKVNNFCKSMKCLELVFSFCLILSLFLSLTSSLSFSIFLSLLFTFSLPLSLSFSIFLSSFCFEFYESLRIFTQQRHLLTIAINSLCWQGLCGERDNLPPSAKVHENVSCMLGRFDRKKWLLLTQGIYRVLRKQCHMHASCAPTEAVYKEVVRFDLVWFLCLMAYQPL